MANPADRRRAHERRAGDEVLIFADIDAARPEPGQGRWYVVVMLHHNKQGKWVIPVASRDAANLWAKIFRLAAVQKL